MEFLAIVNNIVWGPVTVLFLLGTGIYLTFRLGFVQIRYLKKALELIGGKNDNPDKPGELNYYQALSVSLAAVIGTGSFAGVATAIAVGGPGAVFWMWVTAFFSMAIEFASAVLAVQYRRIAADGSIRGGPMYYLEDGLKTKWLAVAFAAFTGIAAFGIGNLVQANSVAEPLQAAFGIPKVLTGVLLGIIVWMVIVGGIKRIGQLASTLVPFMSAVYIFGSLAVIYANRDDVPRALSQIFTYAFKPTAAIGGFIGALVVHTIRLGVARGLFSNEAGLGSSPIAHAAVKTDEPVHQGIVAMVGPFFDTIVICTMTALVIIVTGAWQTGLKGAELSAWAFNHGLPGIGGYIVSFGLIVFAFATVISWSYYGEQAWSYLFGERIKRIYRWIYTLALPLGASLNLGLVWAMADVAIGLMILPNLIGIVGLSGVVFAVTADYIKRQQGGAAQSKSKVVK